MALRAGYYGVKRFLRDKLELIAGTYAETIKSLFPRAEQAVLGATNLLPIEANKDIKITVGSLNLTFSVDSNYYMSCANADTRDENTVGAIYTNSQVKFNLPKGNYILRIEEGTPNTGSALRFLIVSSTTRFVNQSEAGEFSFSLSEDTALGLFAKVRTGSYRFSIIPVGFKNIPFVPYAMTNRELTDSAADQKTAINAIITAATGAADFAAFKTAMGAITPVTRSLSLTKEDITEEVKEVEPEKTVTKKRTTKKTEEV